MLPPHSYDFRYYSLQYHHYQYDPEEICTEFRSHLACKLANPDERRADTAFTTFITNTTWLKRSCRRDVVRAHATLA